MLKLNIIFKSFVFLAIFSISTNIYAIDLSYFNTFPKSLYKDKRLTHESFIEILNENYEKNHNNYVNKNPETNLYLKCENVPIPLYKINRGRYSKDNSEIYYVTFLYEFRNYHNLEQITKYYDNPAGFEALIVDEKFLLVSEVTHYEKTKDFIHIHFRGDNPDIIDSSKSFNRESGGLYVRYRDYYKNQKPYYCSIINQNEVLNIFKYTKQEYARFIEVTEEAERLNEIKAKQDDTERIKQEAQRKTEKQLRIDKFKKEQERRIKESLEKNRI